jgi:hypothetical protein
MVCISAIVGVLCILVNRSRLHLQTTDNHGQLSPPTQSLSFALTFIVDFQIYIHISAARPVTRYPGDHTTRGFIPVKLYPRYVRLEALQISSTETQALQTNQMKYPIDLENACSLLSIYGIILLG